MRELFRIESPLAIVRWQTAALRPPTLGDGRAAPVVVWPDTCEVVYREEGVPQLFEETEYRLTVRARDPMARVALRHRDPSLLRGVIPADASAPDLLVGSLNFRGQVGRSRIEVLIDGHHALSFEVEIFPTKLDYREDYEQLLAEVQDQLTALAFEFLRATHTSAQRREGPPTALEWALQLRAIIDELELGLRHVSRHPIRGLQREVQTVRAERIRRPDAAVLRAARTGAGQGGWIELDCGTRLRERLPTRRAEPTLDTQEHRWFAEHVSRVRRQLAELIDVELTNQRQGARQAQGLEELQQIAARLDGLLRLEPLQAATQAPTPGVMSLQLLGAPGYREAARALITLQLGLRLEGNALELSLKDIATLYEYWCYLAVLDIVAQQTGEPVDTSELIKVSEAGLQVMLKKGSASAARFRMSHGRTVRVEYNPRYTSHVLLSQQPDIVLAIEARGRPTMRIVLDAKYRVDASDKNRAQLGIAGPPADALNVLHRYRDAILTVEPSPDESAQVSRSVVYAASLYPAVVTQEAFERSKLAQQLRTIGIGALPFLPSNRGLVTRWLKALLHRDDWSLGHGAPASTIEPWVWRAASQVVLVGVLRSSQRQPASEHMAWCLKERVYYLPERDTRHKRQLATAYVALYLPASLTEDGMGAITWLGKVTESSVVTRESVSTPWPARTSHEAMRLYQVESWERLPRPIRNIDAHRLSTPRWTTRLAIERASRLAELTLESPLEWSLFDALTTHELPFSLRAGELRPIEGGTTPGRAQFIVGATTITYAGTNGFELKRAGQATSFQPTTQRVITHLRKQA